MYPPSVIAHYHLYVFFSVTYNVFLYIHLNTFFYIHIICIFIYSCTCLFYIYIHLFTLTFTFTFLSRQRSGSLDTGRWVPEAPQGSHAPQTRRRDRNFSSRRKRHRYCKHFIVISCFFTRFPYLSVYLQLLFSQIKRVDFFMRPK